MFHHSTTDRNGGSSELIALDLTHDHKPDNPLERARIEASGGRVVFDGFYNHRVYAKAGKYPGLNMSRALGDLAGYYDAGLSPIPDVAYHKLRTSHTVEEEKLNKSIQENTAAIGAHRMEAIESKDTPDAPEGGGGINSSAGCDRGKKTSVPGSIPDSDSDVEKGLFPPRDICPISEYPGVDEFLLLCSDGVWEFISSQECVELIEKNLALIKVDGGSASSNVSEAGGGASYASNAQVELPAQNELPNGPSPRHMSSVSEAADVLAQVSWNRWCVHMQQQVVDDITAVVVRL